MGSLPSGKHGLCLIRECLPKLGAGAQQGGHAGRPQRDGLLDPQEEWMGKRNLQAWPVLTVFVTNLTLAQNLVFVMYFTQVIDNKHETQKVRS